MAPKVIPTEYVLFDGNDHEKRCATISIICNSDEDGNRRYGFKIKTDANKDKLAATPHVGIVEVGKPIQVKLSLAPLAIGEKRRDYTIKVLTIEITESNEADLWSKANKDKMTSQDLSVRYRDNNFISKIPKFVGFEAAQMKAEGKENNAFNVPGTSIPFKFRTPRLDLEKQRKMKRGLRSRSDPPRPTQPMPMTPLTPFNWGRHLPNPWFTPWVDGEEVLLDEASLGDQTKAGNNHQEPGGVISVKTNEKAELTETNNPFQDAIDLKANGDQLMPIEDSATMKVDLKSESGNGKGRDGSTTGEVSAILNQVDGKLNPGFADLEPEPHQDLVVNDFNFDDDFRASASVLTSNNNNNIQMFHDLNNADRRVLETSTEFFRDALFMAVLASVFCLILGNIMGKLGI